MRDEFKPTDYSVALKRRGTPSKPWRWEINCAGKPGPVKRSPIFFESMAAASKDGKKALARLLLQTREREEL